MTLTWIALKHILIGYVDGRMLWLIHTKTSVWVKDKLDRMKVLHHVVDCFFCQWFICDSFLQLFEALYNVKGLHLAFATLVAVMMTLRWLACTVSLVTWWALWALVLATLPASGLWSSLTIPSVSFAIMAFSSCSWKGVLCRTRAHSSTGVLW